ncbi:MAG: hypothetical protein LBE30_00825 [Comamonas sp.]|jgi:hypothetical protein|nr:hypothetical protein [Comamonas sp.]
MKPATRKIHGWILALLTSVLVIGTVCASKSMTRESVPITLSAGQTVTMSVFRVLPAPARLRLQMPRPNRKNRDNGKTEDRISSAPILLQLKTCNDSVTLQARPETRSGRHVRDLTIWASTDSPQPPLPRDTVLSKLPAGSCELAITVLSVDEQLVGKPVQLVLPPPITYKVAEQGYGVLWMFAFGWPFFALILVLYLLVFAALLAWDSYKQRAKEIPL